MKFKNISLFSLLFATSFLGTSVFGSDELTAMDELTAILNEKEEQWKRDDDRRLKVVDAMNLSYELRNKLKSLCPTLDFSEFKVDCKKLRGSLVLMGTVLSSENSRLMIEQDKLKDEIDAIKNEMISK